MSDRAILLAGGLDPTIEIDTFENFVAGLAEMHDDVEIDGMPGVYFWLPIGLALFDVISLHADATPPQWLLPALQGAYEGLDKPIVRGFGFSAAAQAFDDDGEIVTVRIVGGCCCDGRAALATQDIREGHQWEQVRGVTGLEHPVISAAKALWGQAWASTEEDS